MLCFDTIVSLATPRITSSLAVVRLSGSKAFSILNNIIYKDQESIEINKASLVKLYHDGKNRLDLIDECVIVKFKGPNSFTGFDVVEFYLHGSILIADDLINTLVSYGARIAEKGEFSYQAYFNNKMSLIEAEKINQLIHAKSNSGRKLALKTFSKKTKESDSLLTNIKNGLLQLSAYLEYNIEDEFVEQDFIDYKSSLISSINDKVKPILLNLDLLIDSTTRASKVYSGIKIGIIGKPNVGKSTLLNQILKEEKAIVTDIPGTTRDVVEGEFIYKGIFFKLFDTAGIRKSSNKIENIGIEKSYKIMSESDIILYLSDANFDLKLIDQIKNSFKERNVGNNDNVNNIPLILVKTKSDLANNSKNKVTNNSIKEDITISIKDTSSTTRLFDLVLTKLNLVDVDSIGEHLTSRELVYLERIRSLLKEVDLELNKFNQTSLLSLIADKVLNCIREMNNMLGEGFGDTNEEIYKTIFSSFCLGK